MSRLLVLAVLGLVVCLVIARNVESDDKEKIEDKKIEDEDLTRVKRSEADILLDRDWEEYLGQQKLEEAFKEKQREVMAEFVAVRKMKMETDTGKGRCDCHTFKVKGSIEEVCFPKGCTKGAETK